MLVALNVMFVLTQAEAGRRLEEIVHLARSTEYSTPEAVTTWHVATSASKSYHEGRAAIRHYANQPARPLWPLRLGPNFTLRDRGVNARLA